jgi:hypothetical protein
MRPKFHNAARPGEVRIAARLQPYQEVSRVATSRVYRKTMLANENGPTQGRQPYEINLANIIDPLHALPDRLRLFR